MRSEARTCPASAAGQTSARSELGPPRFTPTTRQLERVPGTPNNDCPKTNKGFMRKTTKTPLQEQERKQLERQDTQPMAPPYTIVVGLQFDDTGLEAVRNAYRLAQLPGARVHLCYAENEVQKDADDNVALLSAAEARLHAWAAANLLDTPLASKFKLHTALDSPATAIIQLAVDVQASLIVVGTHEKSGIEALTDGSVARELYERAPCPLLVAKPRRVAAMAKSPAVEPPRDNRMATPSLGAPHTYGYRRSVKLAVSQSTVGAGAF